MTAAAAAQTLTPATWTVTHGTEKISDLVRATISNLPKEVMGLVLDYLSEINLRAGTKLTAQVKHETATYPLFLRKQEARVMFLVGRDLFVFHLDKEACLEPFTFGQTFQNRLPREGNFCWGPDGYYTLNRGNQDSYLYLSTYTENGGSALTNFSNRPLRPPNAQSVIAKDQRHLTVDYHQNSRNLVIGTPDTVMIVSEQGHSTTVFFHQTSSSERWYDPFYYGITSLRGGVDNTCIVATRDNIFLYDMAGKEKTLTQPYRPSGRFWSEQDGVNLGEQTAAATPVGVVVTRSDFARDSNDHFPSCTSELSVVCDQPFMTGNYGVVSSLSNSGSVLLVHSGPRGKGEVELRSYVTPLVSICRLTSSDPMDSVFAWGSQVLFLTDLGPDLNLNPRGTLFQTIDLGQKHS